jgi:hypothetical protein
MLAPVASLSKAWLVFLMPCLAIVAAAALREEGAPAPTRTRAWGLWAVSALLRILQELTHRPLLVLLLTTAASLPHLVLRLQHAAAAPTAAHNYRRHLHAAITTLRQLAAVQLFME